MRVNVGIRRPSRGFTLIELMIAVVILAIIAAVALPLYTQYSMRTYRAEAQADLMVCAQELERRASLEFNYDGAQADFAAGDLCARRISEEQGRYVITLVAAGNAFTLTATPQDPGPMAGDGALTYNQAGLRTRGGAQGWDD